MSDEQNFFEAISNFTLAVCTPIYWHDRTLPFPKDVRGASCFFLKFDHRLVGVTANHVVDTYESILKALPSLVLQVRLLPFDLLAALIDRDHELDIATFAVSDSELARIGAVAIDCRGQWPPPIPDRFRALSIAGFPEHMRVTYPDKSVESRAYGGLPAVEDVTDREIITTYDPSRDRPLHGLPAPPLGLNLSGCSGGPVLMFETRNGLIRWFPVGLIIGGVDHDSDVALGHGEMDRGENAEFDIVRIRRIHFIRTDGALDHPASGLQGWLPSPT